MLAKELISDVIPTLHTSDTGVKALNWMEVFRISHMPIVNNKEFLGLISDSDIYDLNMADEPIGNHKLSLFSPYVLEDQHIFDVIEIVARMKLTVVPVLNSRKEYCGLINLHDLVQNFAKLTSTDNPGGIIVLDLNVNDYSLSEISRIVEGNDAKILSLYVSSPTDSMKLEVTLKINHTDLTSIIQTFERYNYNIKASFIEDDTLDNYYKNRFDSFMKYLGI